MPKKKPSKLSLFEKRKSFSVLQITIFVLAFGAIGVYVILRAAAAPTSALPECTISPSNPKVGDYTLDITAPLPPVPSGSVEQYYRVKLQTPYNTGTLDATHDPATGIAKLTWRGALVKGRYAFYFINYDKYTTNSTPVRASQTCSVNVR